MNETIQTLQEIQTAEGLSDQDFARRYLSVSATTWYRIKNGTYAANAEHANAKLANNLRNLQVELARRKKQLAGRTFIRLPHLLPVFDAVQVARMCKDEHRLVIFKAPTGGGKTMLLKQIRIDYDGVLVEAKESWRNQYLAAIRDIAKAADINLGNQTSKWSAETSLLAGMQQRGRRVLCIDEGEYFGPNSINLIKLILNQTEWVVVLAAIPVMFDRWNRKSWEESVQLRRRTVLSHTSEIVTPTDVAEFAKDQVKLSKQSQAIIAKAANEFGLLDTIRRILDELQESETLTPTEDEVARIAHLVKTQTAA